VQAQYNLGLLLHEGKGVERNPQEAYFWIKVAALQGDERAAQNIARLAADLSDTQRQDADQKAVAWMVKLRKGAP